MDVADNGASGILSGEALRPDHPIEIADQTAALNSRKVMSIWRQSTDNSGVPLTLGRADCERSMSGLPSSRILPTN